MLCSYAVMMLFPRVTSKNGLAGRFRQPTPGVVMLGKRRSGDYVHYCEYVLVVLVAARS